MCVCVCFFPFSRNRPPAFHLFEIYLVIEKKSASYRYAEEVKGCAARITSLRLFVSFFFPPPLSLGFLKSTGFAMGLQYLSDLGWVNA